MNTKEVIKLKHASAVSIGYPFRGAMKESEGSGVLVIQLKNASGEINWNSCIEVELRGKREPGWLRDGDLIFSTRGKNNYATCIHGIPNEVKVVASPHFFVIRIKRHELLPQYLAWVLNQVQCQRYFQRKSEGTATKSIRRSVLENTPIAIPSLEKQTTIIKLANTLKQEQQILEKIIHNGEITMNAIANDLFTSDTINKQITEKN